MDWFQDRCFPLPLVGMLEGFEGPRSPHRFLRHDLLFSPTTPDHEWVAALSAMPERPVVMTGDHKLFRDKANKAAVRTSGLTYFCLSMSARESGKAEQYAWKVMKLWPDIIKAAEDAVRPAIFEIKIGQSPSLAQLHWTESL